MDSQITDTTEITEAVINSAPFIYGASIFFAAIYLWIDTGSFFFAVFLSPLFALPFGIVAYLGLVTLYFLAWLEREIKLKFHARGSPSEREANIRETDRRRPCG